MSTLLVQELKIELFHDFQLTLNTRQHIGAFIPYLYINNAPVGTFTFEILKDSISILSESFTVSDIKSDMGTTDNYFHLFYPIIPALPLQVESGLYQAKLTATGYSFGSSFIGWIQQHEDIQNDMSYTPISDTGNPLAMRIKTYKQGIL